VLKIQTGQNRTGQGKTVKGRAGQGTAGHGRVCVMVCVCVCGVWCVVCVCVNNDSEMCVIICYSEMCVIICYMLSSSHTLAPTHTHTHTTCVTLHVQYSLQLLQIQRSLYQISNKIVAEY
jgi:hypothetical protein